SIYDVLCKNYCLKNHYATKLGTGWQIPHSSAQKRVFNLSATLIELYFGSTSSTQAIKNEKGCYRSLRAMCIRFRWWDCFSGHEYLYTFNDTY
ncbi:hypothetical protein AB7Y51_27210, partial [Escherichia coli]